MNHHQEKISGAGIAMLFALLLNAVVLERAFVTDPGWYRLCYVSLPLLLISIFIFVRGYHRNG